MRSLSCRWLRPFALVFLLIAGLTQAQPVSAAEKPLALHPENAHYFLFRGKPAVLIASGEHYGALLNRDFDYVPYLKELQARKFNLTRTFSGVYREIPGSFGIVDNTLAPARGRYLCPWPRSDKPGDGGNKFDLSKWDAANERQARTVVGLTSVREIFACPEQSCKVTLCHAFAELPNNSPSASRTS